MQYEGIFKNISKYKGLILILNWTFKMVLFMVEIIETV